MTNSLLTILIIDYANGNRDCEVIEGEFSENVREELDKMFDEGIIENWQMRSAFANGGDSKVEWGSHG